MGFVADFVGDVVDTVGDFIGDAVDFVGDVVEGALDDPIGTIATIAAVATGNAWAVPLINGANVAIQGGDLGDVVKSVAISYAAQGIGQQVGKAVGQAVGAELGSTAAQYGTQYGSQQTAMLMAQEIGLQTANQIAANIVTDFAASGAAAAAVAVVTDRDPVQAFLTGGAAGATPAVLGQIDGFTDLPITAQKVIERGVSAGLSGGDITSAAVGAMITSSQITTDLLGSVDSEYLDDKTKDIVASVLMQTATAAFAGGDPSTAFKNALMNAGSKELGDMLTHEFKMLTDDTYAAAYDMQETAKALEGVAGDFESTKQKYNSVVSNLQTRQANAEKLRDVADKAWNAYQADKTEAKYNAYVSAANAANDYTSQLNADYYNTYEGQLATYEEQLNNYVADYERLQIEFQDRQDLFEDTSDRLSQAMPELRDYANQFFVSEMDPDFDAEAYARLNGLGEEVDPYAHWLEVGQFQGLPTNNRNAEFYLGAARSDLVSNILESRGLSLATASPEIISGLYAQVEATYGDNLTATKYDRGGLGDRLGGALGTARKDLADAILGAKGLSVADADPEVVQQLYENIEATYGNDVQATQSDANGLYGRLSGTGDAYMPPVRITGEAAINRPILGSSSQELQDSYAMPSGWRFATQAEVLNNTAQFHADKNGLVSYLMPSDTEPNNMWVPGAGANQPISILITPPEDSGGAAFADYVYQSPTFDELADIDPEAYLVTMSTIPETVATGTEFGVSQYLVGLAKDAVEYAEKTGDDQTINTVANIIRATGGISEAFGAAISLVTGDNPVDGGLYQFGKALTELGEASNTQEYKDRVAFIRESISDAEGFWDTTKAIFNEAIEDPAYFAAEFIGVEAAQEIVPLAIGGAAGLGVRGVALARGLSTQVANTYATRAAVRGALAADIAESAGASAADAYETTYALAINKGYSEADAEFLALENSQKAAAFASVTTMIAGKVGNAALEKAVFGSRAIPGNASEAFDVLRDIVTTSGKVAIKEGVSEYGEEGLIQAYQEGMYYKLDPTRDVADNIANAATLGMIASGSIAGGVSVGVTTGDMVSNMILSSRPVVEIRENSATVEEARAALAELGLDDDAYVMQSVYHEIDPENYQSVGQLTADITRAIEAETGMSAGTYTFGKNEFANFVGVQTPDLGSTIQEYIDNTYTTLEEVQQKFEGEGFTNFTPEQAEQFVGQGTQADTETTIARYADPYVVDTGEAQQMLIDFGYTDFTPEEVSQFVGSTPETDIRQQVELWADPRVTTFDEANQYLTSYGYNPTEDEVNSFVGQFNQDQQAANIGQYVDPRMFTTEEAIESAAQQGYNLTTEEAQQFVRQANDPNLQSSSDIALQQWADPRAYTEEEALETFGVEGYTPTEEELANYVGQGDENYESDNSAGVTEYADPLAVNRQEAEQALLDLGYTGAAEEEISSYIRQANEVETLAELAEYVDDHQVTRDEAVSFYDALGYTPTEEEITQFVKHGKDILQGDVQLDLDAYVDPRYVDAQEVAAMYDQLGLIRPAPDDVARFVGQYAESELEGKATEYLPTAQYRSTVNWLQGLEQQIGKPYTEVTESDITALSDILAQQQATPDMQLTPEQLAFDYNGDGVIDQSDLTAIQTQYDVVTKGITPDTEFTFNPNIDTVWGRPTGIYADIATAQEELGQQMLEGQKRQDVNAFRNLLLGQADLFGRQATVKAPDPARIGPAYDWSTIFATPQQQQFYSGFSPYGAYAEGGTVEDLLRLLEDK